MQPEHIEDIIKQLTWKQFTMSQIIDELIAHNIDMHDIAATVIKTDTSGNTCHRLLEVLSQSTEYSKECYDLSVAIHNIDTVCPRIYFSKLQPDAIIPKRMHDQDACYDLYSNQQILIHPGQYKLITTDIGIVIPLNYCALVCSRSGIAAKHGMNVMNAPGVIESNYRGAIKVLLHNHKTQNTKPLNISKHSRIAQLLIVNRPNLSTQEINPTVFNLLYGDTDRGENGFGSTGM